MNQSLTRTCAISGQNFVIDEADQAFYQKIGVPLPTLCPEERMRRRLSWRNDNTLYKRTCDFTGETLISMFAPDAPVPVMHKDMWWSDGWDPLEYGQEIDFNRPFFEQFHELSQRVPRPHVATLDSENSLYTNYNGWNKNCYMCFAGNNLEDSLYCFNANRSQDCVDCLNINHCELCYEVVASENCSRSAFVLNSHNCHDCFFIEACHSCNHCVFSSNLRHKSYMIFNKQYDKETYFEELQKLELHTPEGLERAKAIWKEERLKHPKRAHQNIRTENCTGDYITGCKNCHDSFQQNEGGEDCRYIYNGFENLKDSYDCSFAGVDASLCYECTGSGSRSQNIIAGNIVIEGSHDVYYSSYIIGGSHCFGCVGLKKKSYCILNKEYSKEDYETLMNKLIAHMRSTGEWGEFFPSKFSPFAYNETRAQEILPLSQAEASSRNLRWRETANEEHAESNDSKTRICSETGKAFRLTKQELVFYEKMKLPAPSIEQKTRHLKRLKLLNAPKLWDCKCDKTGEKILTSYPPESPFIIYSEKAYLEQF